MDDGEVCRCTGIGTVARSIYQITNQKDLLLRKLPLHRNQYYM